MMRAMTFCKMAARARSLFATAIFLAALCLADSRPASALYQPVIRAGQCSFIYNPVCGLARKRALITYANECDAKAARSRIVAYEACAPDCPTIYNPVCARDGGGKRKTYANECTAKKAGVQIIRHTRCLAPLR
jgi:hypothetical protein